MNLDQGLRQFKLRFESIKVTCKDEHALPFESFEEQKFRLAQEQIIYLYVLQGLKGNDQKKYTLEVKTVKARKSDGLV